MRCFPWIRATQSTSPARRHMSARRRTPPARRLLTLEPLEPRQLLSGSTLGPLVQVSELSPFAACTADNLSNQPGTNYPNSEVEPRIAVNPTNANNAVGIWQQDRWSNNGS